MTSHAPCRPVSAALSRPVEADLGLPEDLDPLFPAGRTVDLEQWQARRGELLTEWLEVLGEPSFGELDTTPLVVDRFEAPHFRGTLYRQPTGPDSSQLLLLMEPLVRAQRACPGAVVPFYHPDLMAGFDLSTREPVPDRPVVQFGRQLVEQGYVVVCTEAFPYNTVAEPEANTGFAWWEAATRQVLAENPRWSGIGKLTWDTARATDLLLGRPDVDRERIVAMGHSLGGKMAFYAGAFDPRIRAVIASDFGIGLSFTNWDAPWYLGERIHRDDFRLAHHQLLALYAPRSFLLIGGQADRPASWQYLLEAQAVYRLHGRSDAVGFLHHGAGHQPTPESVAAAYRWLAEQFDLPSSAWTL